MADIVEDAEANSTRRMRTLLDRLWVEWRQLDYDIETASEDIERIAGEDKACQRLRQIAWAVLFNGVPYHYEAVCMRP